MILFFILKVHFAMTIQNITLFLCIKKLWKQSNVKTIRPKKLWIVQKVLNVEHFNFEELKLIVKLISFRLIFFKLIFLRFVITLFSVALSLFTAKCKKNETVITPSPVTHRYSATYCQAEAVLLYPFTHCLNAETLSAITTTFELSVGYNGAVEPTRLVCLLQARSECAYSTDSMLQLLRSYITCVCLMIL